MPGNGQRKSSSVRSCGRSVAASARAKWARTDTGGQRILTTYKYGVDDGVPANEHGDLVSVEYGNDPASAANVTHTFTTGGGGSALSPPPPVV